MATRLCENCVSGHVLPGEPKGSFRDGAYTYSSSGDSRHESQLPNTSSNLSEGKIAIVLLTDIFGMELKNSKILADSFADRLRCDVLVPDLFNGYPPVSEPDLAPYAPDVPNQMSKLTWVQWVKFGLVWVWALPRLWSGRPAVGLARAENYINMIKSKQIYSKIGVIGYCYGGGVSLILAKKKDFVDAVVSCHAGPVDVADLSKAATPLLMINAEEDQWLPPARQNQAEAALKGNTAIHSKFIMYPGTVHGFAARPNLGIPHVKEAFEKAFEESVEWLSSHL